MINTIIDKAPRFSIRRVIWILLSDTICQLIQFYTNSEAALLSMLRLRGSDSKKGLFSPPRQFFIQVSAENFDCVTIFFGDIVGFNDLTNDCSATEVIESES